MLDMNQCIAGARHADRFTGPPWFQKGWSGRRLPSLLSLDGHQGVPRERECMKSGVVTLKIRNTQGS